MAPSPAPLLHRAGARPGAKAHSGGWGAARGLRRRISRGSDSKAFPVFLSSLFFHIVGGVRLSPPASPVWHMVGLAEQEEGVGPSAQNPQKTSLRGSWFVQRDRPTAAPCPAPAHAVPASHLRSRRWVNAGEAAVVAGPRPPKPLPCLRAFVLPLSPTRSAFPNMVLPAWPLQRIFC